jgi:hypothetical protein
MGLLEVSTWLVAAGFKRALYLSNSRRHKSMLKLDSNQWNLIYNIFSFGLVSMLACTVYTLVSQQRVLAKYRNALVMSSMVTFIAG